MKIKHYSLVYILIKVLKLGSIFLYAIALLQTFSLISIINTYIVFNIFENSIEYSLINIISIASYILQASTLLLIYQNRKIVIHFVYNYRKYKN